MFSKAEWRPRSSSVDFRAGLAEFFARAALPPANPISPVSRLGQLASALCLAAALTACGTGAPRPGPAPLGSGNFPELLQGSKKPPTNVAPAPAPVSPAPPPPRPVALQMLDYADRVRIMSNAELNQEVARFGTPYVPADQLQLALALSQLRQTSELIRAQEWLSRLLANTDPEAQHLHPLTRLLAARYGEQRRLEDLLDKQSQQTRDVQRKLDQTNERLEALKAIERSLTRRTPAPLPAPGKAAP